MDHNSELNGVKKTCKKFVNKYNGETKKVENMLQLVKKTGDADLYIQMCEVAEKHIKFSTEFTTKWQTYIDTYQPKRGKAYLAHFSHYGHFLYRVSDEHPAEPEYYEAWVPVSSEYFSFDMKKNDFILKPQKPIPLPEIKLKKKRGRKA